jgi:dCMP deaminase
LLIQFSYLGRCLPVSYIHSCSGNCLRHRIGCIIADVDQRIIATGYNGTPDNIKACNEGGCKRCWDMSIEHGERLDECICIHGEESALLEAGTNQRFCFLDKQLFFITGRRQCRDATLYVTHNPCRQCSKKIIQSGIKRVVYTKEYPSSLEDVRQLFNEANIELVKQKMESIPLLRLNQQM